MVQPQISIFYEIVNFLFDLYYYLIFSDTNTFKRFYYFKKVSVTECNNFQTEIFLLVRGSSYINGKLQNIL
ncbi:MAG: hypothetical protein EA359_04205 [Balneolaceae bacterium]|nr:MAG: hypothetical protein EA359_04205 [Balneolaceae bacterium]